MDQKSPEAFRTISEVAEWLGVPTHVLRFWESRFSQVKPVKRAGGRRYYRPADMELLGGIRKLLHEDGMTIRGVQKLLREKGVRHVAEMSPPLDLSSETKDVTPGNVVELSDRREAGAEAKPEKTQTETEQADEASEDEVDAPWYDSGIFAQAPEAQAGHEDVHDTGDAEPAREAEAGTSPELTGAEAETPSSDTPGDEASSVDPGDPLPDPDTMEFLAHDATPDVVEPEGAEADTPAPAEPVQTDPTDPMSSPEALDFAAHDAQPETHDTDPAGETARKDDATPGENPPQAAPTDPDKPATDDDKSAMDARPESAADGPPGDGEPAEPVAPGAGTEPDAERPAQQPEPPTPEPTPRPAPVMPEIAPDPADDAPAPAERPMAARIRDLRAMRSSVPAASLRALADRLDEIARRMNENGSPPNGF